MREIKRKSKEILNLNFSRNSQRRRSRSATQSAMCLPQQEQCYWPRGNVLGTRKAKGERPCVLKTSAVDRPKGECLAP